MIDPGGSSFNIAPMTIETDTLDLVVNGARLACADGDDLSRLQRPLRGIALADSPVLLTGAPEDSRAVVEQLHLLGRRAALPLRICLNNEDAAPLLDYGARSPAAVEDLVGTWALYQVGAWTESSLAQLIRTLERFDEARLSGRLAHRDIPRVIVVISPANAHKELLERLSARVQYFKLRLDRR
jgi:hypothetical protein